MFLDVSAGVTVVSGETFLGDAGCLVAQLLHHLSSALGAFQVGLGWFVHLDVHLSVPDLGFVADLSVRLSFCCLGSAPRAPVLVGLVIATLFLFLLFHDVIMFVFFRRRFLDYQLF